MSMAIVYVRHASKKLPIHGPFNGRPFHENEPRTWHECGQNGGERGEGGWARTGEPVQLPV